MCGIAGIWNWNEPLMAKNNIKNMTDVIAHRGPDGEGFWHSNDNCLSLGHRRLSIIDLSAKGNQPMHYLNKYVITFNGEIYNYVELQEVLKNKGYTFESQSDTEVVMAAFDHWGTECLKQFDGMFAFAIYNKEKDELFCARDRFGEKPFFYYHDNNKFFFASEMKALWAGGIHRNINNHSVYLYLNYNLHENPINASQTFFNDIYKLKSGYYFTLKKGQPIIQKQYWKINPFDINTSISFDEACAKFRELFFTSVNRRLRSDVSVGTSLSGGLDSSSVVLAIDKLIADKKNPQKTFSARFKNSDLDEGYFMSKVVEGKNIEHYCTYPDHLQMINQLPKIMYHQEEPFSTASIYAQWEVFKLAKQEEVVVLLDGQGADEYLAGYTHFFVPYFREKYLQGGKKALQKAIRESKENNIFEENLVLDKFFKIESHFPALFNNLRNIKHKFLGVTFDKIIHQNLICEYNNQKAPFTTPTSLNDSLFQYTFNSGLEKLLRFADRNSMAFSREVRLPFLSHEIVEFVFSLPSDYKIHQGWTKSVLRYGLKDILPSEITWRKNKLGFQPPQIQWLNSKDWQEWSNDYHNIAINSNWVNKDTQPSWKTINLGLFENTHK